VTAFSDRDAVRTAQAAGIDTFVVKPYSIGSLIKRVDRASRRTADFIVHPAYVGPNRRSEAGSGRRRLTDAPPPANDCGPESTLRLSPCDDPEADDTANSLLMELYAHIRALEAERGAEQG
jgi:DNA-binding response OmpR family regulator